MRALRTCIAMVAFNAVAALTTVAFVAVAALVAMTLGAATVPPSTTATKIRNQDVCSRFVIIFSGML